MGRPRQSTAVVPKAEVTGRFKKICKCTLHRKSKSGFDSTLKVFSTKNHKKVPWKTINILIKKGLLKSKDRSICNRCIALYGNDPTQSNITNMCTTQSFNNAEKHNTAVSTPLSSPAAPRLAFNLPGHPWSCFGKTS